MEGLNNDIAPQDMPENMEDLKNNVVPHEIQIRDDLPIGAKQKEKDKIYNHEYYQKNKAYWKQPCLCECGLEYKRASKWKHCRSKEHLRRIVNKELHIPNEPLQIDLKGLDCIEDIILTIGKQTFHLLKKKN